MRLERLDVVGDAAFMRIENQVLYASEVGFLGIAKTARECFDDACLRR